MSAYKSIIFKVNLIMCSFNTFIHKSFPVKSIVSFFLFQGNKLVHVLINDRVCQILWRAWLLVPATMRNLMVLHQTKFTLLIGKNNLLASWVMNYCFFQWISNCFFPEMFCERSIKKFSLGGKGQPWVRTPNLQTRSPAP